MRILRRGAGALAAALIGLGLPAPASAIVGGTPATTTDYPWLAAIGTPLFATRASGQFCGGALIAPDQVITAAHCVAPALLLPQVLAVTFGRDDLRDRDGNTVRVKELRIHPDFRATILDGEPVYHDDIAILTLDRPQPSPTVDIAAAISSTGTILGWGATSETDEANTRLRAATVPVVADDDCVAAYGAAFDPRTMLCAGSPDADTAEYDSGGPLLVDGRLVGLTSWGKGAARPRFPTVYSRTSAANF
ncbi:serine protease [Nocardia sp. NPDC049220]|uniref:S1 family peptidase n=1 Tax=Nocardia sp. NPDC049220 TaxID=3155273 RepID=UPI003402A8BC